MTYTGTKISIDIERIPNELENADWPLLIAGPCSAESEEQLVDTAVKLKNTKRVSFFRAGIWKPRTRPNSFEGIGVKGLPWMQTVKKETGFRIATEVANAEHVELALKYGVDLLWVGARTSANPFSVQEIADALKGSDVAVLVKNPVNPDVELWIGALERISKAGIKKLGAIHRGFSSYEKSVFRNLPMWNIPIELKAACPDLPIVCDPSHICGNTELIPFIAQKSLDMEVNGLMIEVHNNPGCAWSDAKQQLTPDQYGDLIYGLLLRSTSPMQNQAPTALSKMREEIDLLDDEIIQKLSLRMKISEKIGQYKKENNVTILQMDRWSSIVGNRLNMGKAMGLSEDFLKKYLDLIHQESINIQSDVMNKRIRN
ncbi:MAG: bifunctional 3-deoxy-7-phosphoheptulonate synthase/chorismate mutase type II [Prevotellaceae bacterium]|jgi:chorismate mutase|nr:bifunctional 3-deoxy-7-phosphoheptulonate synthase/chorismate mutase type II [Prevotellaceae bacterium]